MLKLLVNGRKSYDYSLPRGLRLVGTGAPTYDKKVVDSCHRGQLESTKIIDREIRKSLIIPRSSSSLCSLDSVEN